jgi:hypothetical protein
MRKAGTDESDETERREGEKGRRRGGKSRMRKRRGKSDGI